MASTKRNGNEDYDKHDDAVDWEGMSHGFWGATPFPAHMSQLEVAHLIGWATHERAPTAGAAAAASRNPLLGLPNVPLPPSVHSYLNQLACEEIIRNQEQMRQLPHSKKTYKRKAVESTRAPWDAFDVSAMETVGIVLEEMITASLLPLAKRHVDRCRKLDEQSESVCQDWTLPPEEAIQKLLGDSISVTAGLPTAAPADMGLAMPAAAAATATAANNNVAVNGQSSSKQEEAAATLRVERAIQRWCDSQKLDRQFVQDNADIFRLLFSMTGGDGSGGGGDMESDSDDHARDVAMHDC